MIKNGVNIQKDDYVRIQYTSGHLKGREVEGIVTDVINSHGVLYYEIDHRLWFDRTDNLISKAVKLKETC